MPMNKTHAPLFHIVKRKTLAWYRAWGIRLLAILLALVLDALITTVVTGLNPVGVYGTIFRGSFGSVRKFWVLMQNIAILLCVSIAVTPAFKMRFWNVGGEGQILVGALATAACMILLGKSLPNAVLIPVMTVASIAAGAVWGLIPAFFKAKWNTNETLFTLMMNYVATQLVAYFVIIWEVPKGAGQIGIINQSTNAGWLPQIGPSKYLLNMIVVALLLAKAADVLGAAHVAHGLAVLARAVGLDELVDSLAHGIAGDAHARKRGHGAAVTLGHDAQEQVLRGDVGLAVGHGLAVGVLKHALGTRREGDVPARGGVGLFRRDGAHGGQGLLVGDVELGQRLRGDALPLLDQGKEKVLGPHVHLAETARFFLRKVHDLARLVCELLEHITPYVWL